MSSLQSPWFVSHVIVYIFSCAMLGASSLVAIKSLWHKHQLSQQHLHMGDNLVHIGCGFLSLGLLYDALRAKEARGHYWTWAPNETWAFLAGISYLMYLHFRHHHANKVKNLFVGTEFFLRSAAHLLVWSKLFTFSSAQCTYLYKK